MSPAPILSPAELRGKPVAALRALAEDLRQHILTTCLKNGGHLGASLGTVELALALHATFDSPAEPILWDVGHQAYAHKLLTGRWEEFATLRKRHGLSGFLHRAESPHDIFGAGHSSTALSAALACAWARGRETSRVWTCAVVGDGGLTAGLAFEAFNNLSAAPLGPLLIVLNDNQMSIAPNVGAISTILAQGRSRDYFELLGCDYVGPIDGHDLDALMGTLQNLKANPPSRPVVLHAYTQKGRGYAPAEESPAAFHGVSPMQKVPEPGAPPVAAARGYSEAFGQALVACAERDPKIVAITAAMPEGTGLLGFARKFGERFFDVGIAEPHAVTFAAGLATQGYRPVVAIYSTFLQRAIDSIIHDTALQGLGVVLAIDRAGLVGADGPTHHGAFDLSLLMPIPGLRLLAPSCLADLPELLERAWKAPGPCAIRYPRGSGPETMAAPAQAGVRWHVRPSNACAAIISLGAAAERAEKAARMVDPSGENITVVSTTDAKPIAPALLAWMKANPSLPVLTVEDGATLGGFGAALRSACPSHTGPFALAGYGDTYLPHGSPAELEALTGVSVDGLAARLREFLEA